MPLTEEQKKAVKWLAESQLAAGDSIVCSDKADRPEHLIDTNVYNTAAMGHQLLSVMPKETIAPRLGFIKIKHGRKRFVYPYTWLVSDVGIIDASVLLPMGQGTTYVFVKPLVIDGVPEQLVIPSSKKKDDRTEQERLALTANGEEEKNINSRYIILTEMPQYFHETSVCKYIIENESWTTKEQFDMIWTEISSRTKMKEYSRKIDDVKLRKFARMLK